MEKFFAVRLSLLADSKQRKLLEEFLSDGGDLFPFTVLKEIGNSKLTFDAPFLQPERDVYDAVIMSSDIITQKKKNFIVSSLLEKEGKKSIFFTSEETLLKALKALKAQKKKKKNSKTRALI